jgi:hypothetical protein
METVDFTSGAWFMGTLVRAELFVQADARRYVEW